MTKPLLYLSIIYLAFLGYFFVFSSEISQAGHSGNACGGHGEVSFDVQPRRVHPAEVLKLSATFNWKDDAPLVACQEKPITFDFSVERGSSLTDDTLKEVKKAAIKIGQTASAELLISPQAERLGVGSRAVERKFYVTIEGEFGADITESAHETVKIDPSAPITGSFGCFIQGFPKPTRTFSSYQECQANCGAVIKDNQWLCSKIGAVGGLPSGQTPTPIPGGARPGEKPGGVKTETKTITAEEEFGPPFGIESFTDLFSAILTWLMRIAVPIGVIIIVISGVMMLASGGNPQKVTQAKTILKYAIIGLIIIFIGKGFITLLESILNIS